VPDQPSDIKESLSLFEKDFQLDKDFLALEKKASYSYEEALTNIVRVVEDLLNNDFTRLINTLYRIDVSEQKLKAALAENTDNPSTLIAKMIIERELQKVLTRRKYG